MRVSRRASDRAPEATWESSSGGWVGEVMVVGVGDGLGAVVQAALLNRWLMWVLTVASVM